VTTQLPLFQPPKSKTGEALAKDIWRACGILRRDNPLNLNSFLILFMLVSNLKAVC
jgi:hypothetical protein